MIINEKPISLPEAIKYLDKEKNTELLAFAKKLKVLETKKAEELRKKIEAFENMKLTEKHIAKIIEILPKDKEDLNKIVSEANLDDSEQESVLNVVKEI
jgi:DNA-directed RNA polymerase subunit F